MKYTEFKNGLENGQSFSVYLFEGEDAFFRERGLKLLKNKFLSNPELNLTALEPNCGAEELICALSAYPFMSEKRLVVIREFYPKQEFFKGGFKDYLENPSDYSLLIVINEKPCEPLKKFSTVCTVECNRQDAALLARWIKGECANNGVEILAETAKVIVDYCLSDMTRIENETKKLCCYKGTGGTIERADVDAMVARDAEYKVYEMTDYIAKGKFDLALSVIKDMMSKGETPQRILTAVYNYYRRLLHSAISDMDVSGLSKAFGVKEFAAKKTKDQAAMFKKKSLKSAVDALIDADYKIKSGQADADERMWLTVFKIMTEK
ncbi:MAG: DNA polymerase III subunit delta [Clostridia bacterium]|nr:DNA polymerase III subunit delta [Clostridia bacterium]